MSATVRIWSGIRNRGKCRDCRQWVVWVTSDEGKMLPFQPGFAVEQQVQHPPTGAWFDVVLVGARHQCERKNQRVKR